MKLVYRKAETADASLLIEIYNSAFYHDYIYYGECPAYGRTIERMEYSIEKYPKYIIYADLKPVGAISFKNNGNGIYYLGCLCIIPSYQRMGIGTKAIQYILTVCDDWKTFSLVTPSDKTKNIEFYTKKCGFSVIGESMDGNVEVVNLCIKR
jgi:Acetyltransferases